MLTADTETGRQTRSRWQGRAYEANGTAPGPKGPAEPSSDILELISALQAMYQIGTIYSCSHPLFQRTVGERHAAVAAPLKRQRIVELICENGRLTCQDSALEGSTASARLAKTLQKNHLRGLALLRGVTSDELAALVQVLSEPGDANGSFNQRLAARGVRHIREPVRQRRPDSQAPIADDPDQFAAMMVCPHPTRDGDRTPTTRQGGKMFDLAGDSEDGDNLSESKTPGVLELAMGETAFRDYLTNTIGDAVNRRTSIDEACASIIAVFRRRKRASED